MKWVANPGLTNTRFKPRNPDAMIYVKYRNGLIEGPLVASSREYKPLLKIPSDFDIVEVAIA